MNKDKYTFKKDNYVGGYDVMIENETEAHCIQSPTHNCQLFSIGGMSQILDYTKSDEEIIHIIRKFWDTCTGCKPIMMVDINEYNCNNFERIFTKEFHIMKQSYKSTNNSAMYIYLINIREYFKELNKKTK